MSVDVISAGLIYCSVCTDEPDDAVEARVNTVHPTGITSPWRISMDETFATGQPNPCPCEQDADRRHVLLGC